MNWMRGEPSSGGARNTVLLQDHGSLHGFPGVIHNPRTSVLWIIYPRLSTPFFLRTINAHPAPSRGASRVSSLRGAGCGGRNDAGLSSCCRDRKIRNGFEGMTPAKRADGPSACPGNSLHERDRVGGTTPPGTCSKPKSHPRAERRRSTCFRGRVAFLRRKGRVAPPFALHEQRLPCAASTGCQVCRLRAGRPGAAGAVKRKAFRTPLRRKRKAGIDRQPSAGVKRGR